MRRLRVVVAILLGATGVASAAPGEGLEASTPAQIAHVSGRVVDAAGKPLRGAEVSVEGSTATVRTDADGRFTLDATPGASLVVLADGYGAALGTAVDGAIDDIVM